MHISILFFLFFTFTFTAATPGVDWSELQEPEDKSLMDTHNKNKKIIQDASDLSDKQLESLHTALYNTDDPMYKDHLVTAFGADAISNPTKLDKLKDAVEAMKATDMKVKSVIPKTDSKGEVASVPKKDGKDDVVVDGKVQYTHLEFGNQFFDSGYSLQDQAGFMNHEKNHYKYGGEDDVVGAATLNGKMADGIKAESTLAPHERTINMKTPGGEHDVLWRQGGYARVMKAGEGDDTEVKLRYALHNDIVPNGGAMLDGTPHADLRNHVKNPDKNPDFFRIGALLAHDAESKNPDAVARAKEAAAIASSKRTADKAAIEAAERERQAEIASKAESVRLAREAAKKSGGGGSESGGSCDMGDFELRKRALTQDDPIGYYLAKRAGCLAKIKKTMDTEGNTKADKQRAANDKVAAWLGTQGATKAAQTSTTPRSAPKELKGVKPAKEPKATKERKAANGLNSEKTKSRRAAKAGRGANGVRKPRTNSRKPRTNGRKATKGGKGVKAANRRNSKKGAKSSKAMRGSKAGRAGRVARKSGKGGRVARKAGRAGRVARKGAKSNRKSNRKSVGKGKGKGSKTAKGVKGTKSKKGSKASKGVKRGKSKKGLKAKGRKAAKGGKRSKAVKGSKAKGGKSGKGKAMKGGKGVKKGGKVAKKGGKPAKKGSNASKGRNPHNARAKGGKNGKGAKAGNGRGSKAAKGGKTNNRAQGTRATRGARQTGSRNPSKAAARPQAQQRVSKAAPKAVKAAPAVVPKKAGKRN